MPRSLWPACEERTADAERHVATNRVRERVRRCDVHQRAQGVTDDQAHERQQRRPARNSKSRFANTKPRHETREALRRKMVCRLTLELSGGEAVRLNDWLGICGPSATRRTTRHRATAMSHKPHALKLDDLPQTPNRLAEGKHYTTTR
jgi:hypothetical protein